MAGAVLIRAIAPREGDRARCANDAARWRRRTADERLGAGPALLCQAFGITRALDGHDLTLGDRLWLAKPRSRTGHSTTCSSGRASASTTPASGRAGRGASACADSPSLSRPFPEVAVDEAASTGPPAGRTRAARAVGGPRLAVDGRQIPGPAGVPADPRTRRGLHGVPAVAPAGRGARPDRRPGDRGARPGRDRRGAPLPERTPGCRHRRRPGHRHGRRPCRIAAAVWTCRSCWTSSRRSWPATGSPTRSATRSIRCSTTWAADIAPLPQLRDRLELSIDPDRGAARLGVTGTRRPAPGGAHRLRAAARAPRDAGPRHGGR